MISDPVLLSLVQVAPRYRRPYPPTGSESKRNVTPMALRSTQSRIVVFLPPTHSRTLAQARLVSLEHVTKADLATAGSLAFSPSLGPRCRSSGRIEPRSGTGDAVAEACSSLVS
jgi:hypothetical protein